MTKLLMKTIEQDCEYIEIVNQDRMDQIVMNARNENDIVRKYDDRFDNIVAIVEKPLYINHLKNKLLSFKLNKVIGSAINCTELTHIFYKM